MKKIYLISLLTVSSLNLFCQFDWTKYPDNPVMVPGPPEEWEEETIEPGSVILYDNIYHMSYSYHKTGNRNRIGHATSPDGINWSKDTNNPVLVIGEDGDWDDLDVYGGAVLVIDSIFHMWYTGRDYYNRDYCIGHATSPDGATWTKDENNPVLMKGAVGSWDDVAVYGTSVIYDGSEFHMWYSGWNGTDLARIGHATSPDGVSWTKDPLNPVLTCQAEEWDYPYISVTTVLFDSNTYHMWYESNRQIGYTTSKDGSAWTKYASNPVLTKGSTGDWDGYGVSSAAVIDSSGVKYKMWYLGQQNSLISNIGYAESIAPPWKQMTSMDIARGAAVSCVIDSMLYVFGGTDKYTQTVDSADVYNTKTDEWSDLAPVPMDLSLIGSPIGDIDGKIYFTGGWQRTGSTWMTLDSTFAYDPEADSWEMKKECPKKTGGHASCVLNGKLYLLGGTKDWPENDTSGQKDALVYDPATDTWDSLPDMLYAHGDGSTACIHDGKIYVLGGITWISGTESNIIGKAEMYDPVENTWTALADMPVPVAGHINLVYEDKIYVFGGDSSFSTAKSIAVNIIQEYDPSTNVWRKMHGMPFNRSGMMGHNVGDFAYLIGGYPYDSRDFPSVLSEVWKFDLRELKPFTYATGVSLDKDTLDLLIDATGVLVATVYPADASDPSVSWYSDLSWPVIATVKDGIVTGFHEGVTYVYVTTNDGHFKDSCFVNVITTSITNIEATGFKLYPNPAIDLITLEFKSPGTHTVEISSLNGQLLYNSKVDGATHQIDLSSFEKGLYVVRVKSRDYVGTEKIIKQ